MQADRTVHRVGLFQCSAAGRRQLVASGHYTESAFRETRSSSVLPGRGYEGKFQPPPTVGGCFSAAWNPLLGIHAAPQPMPVCLFHVASSRR